MGYNTANIPFCYLNEKNEAAGFDMAFAYQLALDLECKLELVPLNIERLDADFEAGEFDIVMSGLIMTEERLTKFDFTQPYYNDLRALVVRAGDKAKFLHLEAVKAREGLRIGGAGAYAAAAKRLFPKAAVETAHRPERCF